MGFGCIRSWAATPVPGTAHPLVTLTVTNSEMAPTCTLSRVAPSDTPTTVAMLGVAGLKSTRATLGAIDDQENRAAGTTFPLLSYAVTSKLALSPTPTSTVPGAT